MTDYKSTIAELHYLADWAKHHLDKAKIANDAAVSIGALQAENERLKDDLDDAIRGPWAEWAEKITKSVRKRSGYDGFDDQAEGVDLPTEVEDCLCELEHLIKKIASERDAMQAKLGDAIQSSAHWQHQFTEARAENERLKVESTNKNDWLVEQRKWEAHANDLQAKLDAMGKGEPVAYSVGNTLKWHEGKGMTNAQLFAAPKALAPLTQPEVVEAFCNTRHNTQYVSVFDAGVRFAEKHHGIGGTP